MPTKYSKIIKRFKHTSILVIGDVMLDEYIWGKVDRISPEAPVQVVEVKKVSHVPGGAANVANNVASLSGKSYIIGVTGNDKERGILHSSLEEMKIEPHMVIEDRPTIKKVRVMGHGQQLLRIDYEKRNHIDFKTEKKILENVKRLIPEINCIVISDYAKGLVTSSLVEALVSTTADTQVKIIVDPKPRNMKYFMGVDLITPNHNEAAQYANIEENDEEDLKKIGRKISRNLESNCLITRGEKGMSLFERGKKVTHIPTMARQVYDVTGAGDTVIGAVALSLGSGADYKQAATIANYAAGIVVGKLGTATVTVDELKQELIRDDLY